MVMDTQQTVGQWLEELARGNTSTERDGIKMQSLLRRINFPSAICTCGIAYLEGHGTMDFPPMAINSLASMLVNKAKP